ncbi:hypothetical protein [Methyloraptor flagellatus]|uniref:Uncharacterized protein n=1 Tax=Methyloraptor flagellatus TaxID=3162530 RepID=A0AAU7XCF7_9HYPH
MKTAAILGMTILLAGTAAARADYNFLVPDKCWNPSTQQYDVTGADGAESDEPPVVTITYNVGSSVLEVTSAVTLSYNQSSKLWSASVALPYTLDPLTTYLVTTTYTPFLQSYLAIDRKTAQPFELPPASWNNQQFLRSITITVTDQKDQPIPNGFIEMAPNFGGSSPYTLQADGSGNVEIYCYTSYVDGNPATILDAQHNLLYSTRIVLKADKDGLTATGVAAPEK